MQNHLDIIAAQRSRVQRFTEVARRAPIRCVRPMPARVPGGPMVFGGRAE
jgi:hypothetical protein